MMAFDILIDIVLPKIQQRYSKIVYSLEKIFDGEKRFNISSNFSGFRIKKTGIRPRGKIYWVLKRAKSAFEIEMKITETF